MFDGSRHHLASRRTGPDASSPSGVPSPSVSRPTALMAYVRRALMPHSVSEMTSSIADILDAEPRAAATKRIKNDRLRRIAEAIDAGGRHDLPAARLLLRSRELGDERNYFNSQRPLVQLQGYVTVAGDLFAHDALASGPVLEFGSGTRNSVSLGALLYVNGAPQVTCYEPGRVNLAQSGLALRELLVDVIRSPSTFNISGGPDELLVQRAVDLLCSRSGAGSPLELIGSLDAVGHDVRFTLVLSNHVFEHVDDPCAEWTRLRGLSAAGGRQLHRVDFRDHRTFKPGPARTSPLHFYADGELTSSNGLRPSDIERALTTSGWSFRRLRTAEIDPKKFVPPKSRRFAAYPTDELSITEIDYLLW